jgi:hypothetical protein
VIFIACYWDSLFGCANRYDPSLSTCITVMTESHSQYAHQRKTMNNNSKKGKGSPRTRTSLHPTIPIHDNGNGSPLRRRLRPQHPRVHDNGEKEAFQMPTSSLPTSFELNLLDALLLQNRTTGKVVTAASSSHHIMHVR